MSEKKCEGCGTIGGAEYIKVRTTNGALTLCRQCLDDINRKNPEVAALKAEIERLNKLLAVSSSEVIAAVEKIANKITEDVQGDNVRLLETVARLKRGDFTPDEFQNLCHHRDEKPGCTQADFDRGCREYQANLFGCGPTRPGHV